MTYPNEPLTWSADSDNDGEPIIVSLDAPGPFTITEVHVESAQTAGTDLKRTPEDWEGYHRLVNAAAEARQKTNGYAVRGIMVNIADIEAVQRIIESEF